MIQCVRKECKAVYTKDGLSPLEFDTKGRDKLIYGCPACKKGHSNLFQETGFRRTISSGYMMKTNKELAESGEVPK